jgi:HD-GYP domain-containing protein (c-di-GMP phosphodiesterase class II)
MAHVIIWGDPRSVLGGTHAGVIEVRSFAGLKTALDGRGAALVLAGLSELTAEQGAVEAWLKNGASKRVWLVAATDAGGDSDGLLERFPFLHDVVARPVSPVRLRLTLERAFETMNARGTLLQLQDAYERRGAELSVLNKIGMQLSAERDIDKLLDLILQKSREITGADAGSLYLVERTTEDGNGAVDRLRFKLAQNDTMPLTLAEKAMPLDKSSIAGYVAVTGETQNVQDAYQLPANSPFHISRTFDDVSGYRTKSLLVVPMRDHLDTVIGVVQLINKKRDRSAVLRVKALVDEQVIPFTSVDNELVESLTSQAAVAFENAALLKRMRDLFDDFVGAAVAAVEQRDPTTSGHSARVAILTVGLMEKIDQISSGPLASEKYTPDQVEEVRYAALLHDFGKVAVQERYLRKERKLYAGQLIALRQRFAYILRSLEADYLRARLHAHESGDASPERIAAIEADYHGKRVEAERVREVVEQANQPTVVEAERERLLASLPTRSFSMLEKDPEVEDQDGFPVEAWANGPWLSTKEVELLSIRKGSLSAGERKKIENHVTKTYEFLNKLPWTGELRRVPEIAWAHHEKLDGTGYPRGLKAAQIPRQSRMMTISDIYDALVAWDRPYKKSVSEEQARAILCEEAQHGKIDAELLQVFLEAEIYRLPEFRDRLQKRT